MKEKEGRKEKERDKERKKESNLESLSYVCVESVRKPGHQEVTLTWRKGVFRWCHSP